MGEIEEKGGEEEGRTRVMIKGQEVRSRIIAIEEKLVIKGREERRRNTIIK